MTELSKNERVSKARESYGFPNEPVVDEPAAVPIFRQAATAEKGAPEMFQGLLWNGGKPAEKTSGLNGVSFGQLYLFLWKLALAGAAFALPFVIFYLIIANVR